jgi:hypothetical protein
MSTDRPDLESLIERLKALVEERRERGEYPPSLEQELNAHFEWIAALRSGGSLEEPRRIFEERLEALKSASNTPSLPAEVESRVPGGRFAHRIIRKLTARQQRALSDQVQQLADATYSAFEAMDRSERGIIEQIFGELDALIERMLSYERAPTGSGLAERELHRRIERLEELERARRQDS